MTTFTGRRAVHIRKEESIRTILLRGIQRIVQGTNWPRRDGNLQRKIFKRDHFTHGDRTPLTRKTLKSANKV